MTNNAVLLDLLKADWEAKRVAFELARSSPFGALPLICDSPDTRTQISLEFVPWPGDHAISDRDLQPPSSIVDVTLVIGDIELDCAVLEDGSRIISETKFMEVMGMYRSGALSVRRKDASAPIPLFLAHKNLKPYAEKHLGGVHFELKPYRTERGGSGQGIPAETLPKVCEVWMDANRDGVLGPRQQLTAKKAEILFRGFAHVGIVALIDEATGYQRIRDREALQAILDAYLRKELAAGDKRP
ncbi:MAG: hypothetical protein ABIH23_09060 [bacterium]